jgi:hypothetical protein
MKLLICTFLIFSSSHSFSQLNVQNIKPDSDSVTLANGKIVSRAEMDSIFKKAWEESFGKMTEEDKNLFNNTNISIVTEDEKIEDENIVSIGNQMWKAENLNTETVRNVDPFSDSVVNDYFVKITQYSEHKTEKQPIKKFEKDVNIYIHKDYTIDEVHLKEVKKVIKELRILTGLKINFVNKKEKANYIIVFGGFESFKSYHKTATQLINFEPCRSWIGATLKSNMDYGSIDLTVVMFDFYNYLLDTDTYMDIIREEITQGFGLINDTYDYPESVFYQGPNFALNYTELQGDY